MDVIKYEILEDGTVSIETDAISGKNHYSADQLLKQLAELVGGPVEIKHKHGHVGAHTHTHGHGEHHHHH